MQNLIPHRSKTRKILENERVPVAALCACKCSRNKHDFIERFSEDDLEDKLRSEQVMKGGCSIHGSGDIDEMEQFRFDWDGNKVEMFCTKCSDSENAKLAEDRLWDYSEYYQVAVSMRSALDRKNRIKTRQGYHLTFRGEDGYQALRTIWTQMEPDSVLV